METLKALVRGTVSDAPQYVKNGSEERCIFTLGIKVTEGTVTTHSKVRVVTNPKITADCHRAQLAVGSPVVALGDLGVKSGHMKFQANDMAVIK